MKMSFCSLLLLGILGSAASGVELRVTAGKVDDRRTTGEHFAGLDVELKLSGDDLARARAVKVEVSKAVDDTGRDLLKQKDRFFVDGFKPIDSDHPTRTRLELKLRNPLRKAQTVSVAGTLHVHVPDADPASVVLLENYSALSAKPIEHAAFKSAGIELRIFTKADMAKLKEEQKKQREEARKAKSGSGLTGWAKDAIGSAFEEAIGGMLGGFGMDGDVGFLIKDEHARIVRIEFRDAAGREIERRGWSRSGSVQSFSFGEKLPPNANVAIYLATEKSILAVPFALQGVELP